MIILDRSQATHTLNFIPKNYTPTGAAIFKVTIKNETQDTQTFEQTFSSFSAVKYYFTVTANFGFDTSKDLTYTLEINDTVKNEVIYRDKLFVTNQSASSYSINSGEYTFESTSTNEYLIYE
jgi:hypothetical protein